MKANGISYIYGVGLIGAFKYGLMNVHGDGPGSTRALTMDGGTNENGYPLPPTLVASYDYDAFGTRRSPAPSANYSIDLHFAGELLDSTTGYYYLRARHYDPATGRFVQKDPMGGLNPYVYANNNPVSRVDPTGLCDEDHDCGDGRGLPTVVTSGVTGPVTSGGVTYIPGSAPGGGSTGSAGSTRVQSSPASPSERGICSSSTWFHAGNADSDGFASADWGAWTVCTLNFTFINMTAELAFWDPLEKEWASVEKINKGCFAALCSVGNVTTPIMRGYRYRVSYWHEMDGPFDFVRWHRHDDYYSAGG